MCNSISVSSAPSVVKTPKHDKMESSDHGFHGFHGFPTYLDRHVVFVVNRATSGGSCLCYQNLCKIGCRVDAAGDGRAPSAVVASNASIGARAFLPAHDRSRFGRRVWVIEAGRRIGCRVDAAETAALPRAVPGRADACGVEQRNGLVQALFCIGLLMT